VVSQIGDQGVAVTELKQGLRAYGYGVDPGPEFTAETAAVVTAFQRHFRPARVDGVADFSTVSTLGKLIAAVG
jgi:N-acetylmuramoyl-L-alanine amidase